MKEKRRRRYAAGVLRRSPRAWWALLVFPAAVLAVHQLRYLLAYGSHAGSALSSHGDRYVATATSIAGTLVAMSVGIGVLRLVAAWRGHGRVDVARSPLWLLWLGFALLLLAGFCALEGLEMAFEPHHGAGLDAIFGAGGWWALPASALVGAVMALFAHGGRTLLVFAARRSVSRADATTAGQRRELARAALPRRPMATCAPGRAPPVSRLA